MNILRAEMRSRWDSDGWHYDDTHAHGIHDETERTKWRSLLLGFPKGTNLLDAGSGTGFVALLAAEQGLDTTGVDWSETMLAQAREKAAAQNLEVRFVPGEMENLPFEDNRFQALTARHVLWTLIEPVQVFREWQRVLAPGGAVFADYTPRKGDHPIGHHYREETEQKLPLNRDVSAEEIGGLFREGGFAKVSFGVQEEAVKHADHSHIKKVFLFTCIK